MTMTAAEFLAVDQQVPDQVERDGWQRPLIEPAPGAPRDRMRTVRGTDRFGNDAIFQTDKPAYTRASTLGKALDDETGLTAWKKRMILLGAYVLLIERPLKAFILAIAAHRGDPKQMDKLVDEADVAAESGAAATSGTALHKVMDLVDEGHDPYVPDQYRTNIAEYVKATSGMRMVRKETFVVDDELQCAGSYDRLWELTRYAVTPDGTLLPPGTRLIGDLKTGKDIKYGHCGWSAQLSVYAHGLRYDPETESRLQPEDINQDWGLIVHAPIEGMWTDRGVFKYWVELYWIDLRKGRELAHLSHLVREQRKSKTMRPADLSPGWRTIADAARDKAQLRAVWASAHDAGALDADLKTHLTARAQTLAG